MLYLEMFVLVQVNFIYYKFILFDLNKLIYLLEYSQVI